MFLQDLDTFPTDDARLAGDAGLHDRRLLILVPRGFPSQAPPRFRTKPGPRSLPPDDSGSLSVSLAAQVAAPTDEDLDRLSARLP